VFAAVKQSEIEVVSTLFEREQRFIRCKLELYRKKELYNGGVVSVRSTWATLESEQCFKGTKNALLIIN